MSSIDIRDVAADLMHDAARDIDTDTISNHLAEQGVTAPGIRAAEVAELIATADIDIIWRDAGGQTEIDRLRAEVDRLRAQLEAPCGSCHPCTNWADETWRQAGRKPPTVVEWDAICAELADLRPIVEAAKAWVRIRRDKSADGGTYHDAGRALAGAVDALANGDRPACAEPPSKTYLIWSNHHKCWWGPDGCGYRRDINNAGRYTLEATKQWLSRSCGCCLVPEVVVPAPPTGPDSASIALLIARATEAEIAAGRVNKHAEQVW